MELPTYFDDFLQKVDDIAFVIRNSNPHTIIPSTPTEPFFYIDWLRRPLSAINLDLVLMLQRQ